MGACFMKRYLLLVLVLCLAVSVVQAEEMEEGSFLFRVWNRSGLEILITDLFCTKSILSYKKNEINFPLFVPLDAYSLLAIIIYGQGETRGASTC